MKTFYDIILDVSNLRWSIVDPEPASFEDVQKAVKLAIPQAHSYIWNLQDFFFKERKTVITLNAGENAFLSPSGTVKQIWINGDDHYLTEFENSEDVDFLESKSGQPTQYWVEMGDEGPVVRLYPMPEKPVQVFVRYDTSMKAKTADGREKSNYEAMDDVLNLPDDPVLQDLYLHCLNTKAMVYLVADETDENYKPYQREFEEAYRSLLKYRTTMTERRFVI